MRGLPKVSFILLDEADFFPPGQQQDARDVSERYIAKSDPYIVMVSTPNAPEGLFERIEKEAEDTCLYKRIFLDYTYGIVDDFNQFYFSSRSMGIDPAYGSSAFGIVVTQWVDHHIQIMHAEEYHRPDYNEMLSTVYSLMSKYHVDKVYIDGANPSFIKSLKLQIGEDQDYDKVIARHRSEKMSADWSQDMRIVPVNFNAEHKAMLGHCKM
ncbi:MAG: hypothetical protein ACJ72U_08570, partial [Nitrososphaeraceae archaeon]